jgi:hypothetical protein
LRIVSVDEGEALEKLPRNEKAKGSLLSCSDPPLPLGGIARSAQDRDNYDHLSFDGKVDCIRKSTS